MSDLDQLRAGLDEALRAVSPGPAPVDRVVRRGRGIRARRRLTALAGIAAVAAAAVAGYPAIAHKQPAPAPRPPVTRHHMPSVTDTPPGRGAPPGVIATGLIFGAPWQVEVYKLGTHGTPSAPAGQRCFRVPGSATALGGPLTQCLPTPAPSAATPVAFTGFTCAAAQISVGRVLADVRYATVDLSDGTRLKLIPVSVNGTRYVAFALPESLSVDRVTAYLSNGQYLTAVPFNGSKNLTMFGLWQRAGEPVPPRITRQIGTDPADKGWRAVAYAGPWGVCLTDSSADSAVCVPTLSPLGTGFMAVAPSTPHTAYGSAISVVSYLKVTLTHGAPLRVYPVQVGNQKFFAFRLGAGQSIKHWTAYDAAGAVCASGGAPTSHQ